MKRYFLILLLAFNSSVLACSEPTFPDITNLDKYSTIFFGEITGVSLLAYERDILWDTYREDEISPIEGQRTHEIRGVVRKTFKGAEDKIFSTKVEDCGIFSPSLRTKGVFFKEKKTGKLIPVYSNYGERYNETIVALYELLN